MRLIRCEGIGPRTFRALVNRYGGAGEALRALPELARRRGRGELRIPMAAEIEREMEAARRWGVRFVATGEAEYPRLLAATDTAPPLIAVRGEAGVLGRPCVAMVGSRNASAGGLALAGRLARELSEAGVVVVSGLARGVDASAHRGALERGTVAVLAGGHDRLYPPENAALLDALLETGCAVAEMPMGWTPRGRDFPRRNRIVSGLSHAVIVIEAARKSGSLITARFALEQGREVLAVPGSPLDPRAEGANSLIRQGATLVTCAEDVLEALEPALRGGPAPSPPLGAREPRDGEGEPLWDEYDLLDADADGGTSAAGRGDAPPPAARANAAAGPAAAFGDAEDDAGAPPRSPRETVTALLGVSPVPVDELVRASGLASRTVQLVLFDLEEKGRLDRHGAALVSLRPPGDGKPGG
nr:DNA-processing protein DprA [Alsobacter ponti]